MMEPFAKIVNDFCQNRIPFQNTKATRWMMDDFENIESKIILIYVYIYICIILISVHCSVQLLVGYTRGNITISKNDSLPRKY